MRLEDLKVPQLKLHLADVFRLGQMLLLTSSSANQIIHDPPRLKTRDLVRSGAKAGLDSSVLGAPLAQPGG